MIVFYLFLCIIVIIFLSLCYVHLIKYKDLRGVPGPSVVWTILSVFYPKPTILEAFELLTNLNKLYGPVAKIWINPFSPKLIVTDLKYIESILYSTAHLEKTKFYRYLGSLDEGLAVIPAEKWKIQRKIFNAAFRSKTLKGYVKTFEKFGDELITEMANYAGGPSFDVSSPVLKYSMYIVCATLLQYNSRCTKTDLIKYSHARESLFRILMGRSLSILSQCNFLSHLTRTYMERERHAKILNDFSQEIIGSYARQQDHVKIAEVKHVVDYILENYGFGSKEMLDHTGTFIVAGHETVAGALSFGLYELSKHPEVQKKIVEESNSVLGKNIYTQAKASDLQNLKYLECVIKEILRKYTVVPVFERKTTQPMEINGVRVPEGTDIAINAYNVHMDEDNYPNPEVFDPDRFLPENEDKLKPFAYLSFCLGPRNCIGKRFAILEIKSLLTKILRHYEVFPVENVPPMKFFSEFTLKSTIGTPLTLKLRRSHVQL